MKNLLGVQELRREIMSEYIMNMETQKLELHFEKADYMALSEELKKEIKSNFLFSRKAGAWISRTKQLIMQKYSAEIENAANIFRADKKYIGFISLLVVEY